MPIRQSDVISSEPLDGLDFEKDLAKYYALLEHSEAKDVKLFFYGELTRLLQSKLAQERQLRRAVEKELDRVKAIADNKPDIEIGAQDTACLSVESLDAVSQSESLKAEVQRAWSVAAMIEENLCKKEIELDRKEQKVRELEEKLSLAVQQSRAAAWRLRENYQNLVSVPPTVEIPNLTVKVLPISRVQPSVVKDAQMPRLEHPTKRVKVENSEQPNKRRKREHLPSAKRRTVELQTSAKKRKAEHHTVVKKNKIKNCTKNEKKEPGYPPLVALQDITNNEPFGKAIRSQTPDEEISLSSRRNPSLKSYKRGPLLKKKRKTKRVKKQRGPFKPMYIFCLHCKQTRQLLPRKDGSGFTFRHTCPMEPTAKRVTQNVKYKVTTCKLNHEGPCARLATPEEMKSCKRKGHGQAQKQTPPAKKKSVTIGA